MAIDEQIEELNRTVKCRLAPSSIHGIGVFAIRDIKAGEKLYCERRDIRKWFSIPYSEFDRIRPEVRELILRHFAPVIHGSLFWSPNDFCWLVLYMNHSSDPSYQEVGDVVLRDIVAGEEVFKDYGEYTEMLLGNKEEIRKSYSH